MVKLRVVAAAMLLVLQAHAQQALRGSVKDEKNEPLIGATVTLVKTGAVTVTDGNGNFSFPFATEGTYEAEVRFLGYQKKLVVLSNSAENIVSLEETVIVTDEVLVTATRALENSPTTFSNVSKTAIQKQNFGQDIPFVLNWTPSLVTTSDAGAGIGYTGLRIRGSDATRINVTINGIPLNDSESQGVFWVNTPDLASSTQSIQVQRGVGTSSNGAGAFGASVNIQTNV
ncbi:MAG: carboxypeptidase-like regulatory domain-containing protein, partial [Flammeovirgaceae bacterium]